MKTPKLEKCECGLIKKACSKHSALSRTSESTCSVSEQKLKEATTKLFEELRISCKTLDQTGIDVLEENFWELLA